MRSLRLDGDVLIEVTIICFELPSEHRGMKSLYIWPHVSVTVENPDTGTFRSLRLRFYDLLHQITFRTPVGWITLDSISPEVKAELDTISQLFDYLKQNMKSKKRKTVDFPKAVYKIKAYLPVQIVCEWLDANIKHIREKLKALKRRDKIRLWSAVLEMLEKQRQALLNLDQGSLKVCDVNNRSHDDT